MTKQELERYLEIETILKLHKIVIDKDGFMSCPFHSNCEKSLKLYPELNGVACMRESCSNYRKVLDAFSILQELEGIKTEEARLYGKSLLLQELERLRGNSKPTSLVLKSIDKKDKSLLSYWELLKAQVLDLGKGDKHYEFKRSEIKVKGVSRSSQHNYIQDLLELGYLRQSSGYSNKGYYYQVTKWD